MSFWGQIGLQEGTRVLGVEIQALHDYGIIIMVGIFSFVGFMLFKVLVSKYFSVEYLQSQWLEVVWTILPCGLLLMLGLPSIKLLYLMDELELPEGTVKIVGHQWYWRYEYSDSFGGNYRYDSYIARGSESRGDYRLLEVSNRCVVAAILHMRGLVTSDDVIHSWAMPSASIKADAIPGRINQIGLCFIRSGVFYGECRELCGINHSFIPICVEAVSVEVFTMWIVSNHESNLNKSNRINKALLALRLIYDVFSRMWASVRSVARKLIYLYYWWFKNVFYYGLYVPAEFCVKRGWRLLKWGSGMCLSFIKWAGWFLVSPLDASLYAVTYTFGQVCRGIWYVVTKPIEFTCWSVKSVIKGIRSLFRFSVFLIRSVVRSISRFTDDGFKEVVMERVNLNTFKFLWLLQDYYKNRR